MTTNDIDRLAMWAVRYALGRSTYAVSDVVEVLIRRRGQLQVKTALVIARDIDEAERDGALGMEMDAREWRKLRDALRS